MNDVKDLLARALDDGPNAGLVDHPEMDPTGDLRRGRAKLRKRRTAGLAGAAAVALGVGIVPLTLGGNGAATGVTTAGSKAAVSTATPTVETLPKIELAAYTGKQVPGYTVQWMPKGWVIQGGGPTYLTIAPKDAKDQNPSYFMGKLMLGLTWHGFKPPTAAQARKNGETSQPVDGRPGWLAVAPKKRPAAELRALKLGKGDLNSKYDPYMGLTYEGKGGQWLFIQVPQSIGWTGAEMAEFASGVTVLKNAAKSY